MRARMPSARFGVVAFITASLLAACGEEKKQEQAAEQPAAPAAEPAAPATEAAPATTESTTQQAAAPEAAARWFEATMPPEAAGRSFGAPEAVGRSFEATGAPAATGMRIFVVRSPHTALSTRTASASISGAHTWPATFEVNSRRTLSVRPSSRYCAVSRSCSRNSNETSDCNRRWTTLGLRFSRRAICVSPSVPGAVLKQASTASARSAVCAPDGRFSRPRGTRGGIPAGSGGGWFLQIEERRVALREGEFTIGRSRGCGVVRRDPSVRRGHALLCVSRGKVTLQDLRSSNGTYVNGKRLDGEVALAAGDRLVLGETELFLRWADSRGEARQGLEEANLAKDQFLAVAQRERVAALLNERAGRPLEIDETPDALAVFKLAGNFHVRRCHERVERNCHVALGAADHK